jgi:tetratricopeptide (TPR) repeat protein
MLITTLILLNWLLFANSTTVKTILPVLVTAQTVLLYSWYGQLKSKWIRIVVTILLIVCGSYIIYSQSRASWVGLVAGLLTLAYLGAQQQPKKQIPPPRFVSPRTSNRATATGILVALVLAMVFLFKTGSSQGRLLIYKVIAKNVTAKDLVYGIEKGRFKATYNNWQANYFQHHDINTKEALLADNTYYAFNDYLQLLLERGIAGMALLPLLGIMIVFLFKQLKRTAANSMAKSALASAMVILTAALFSYPLQNIPVQVHLLLCLLMMINGMGKANNQLTSQLINMACILMALLLGVKEIRTQKYERQKETAITCSRTGHKKKAMEQLEQLISKGYKEGNVLYLYARELYYAGQTEKALEYLNQSRAYISNLETEQLLARLYEERGVLEKAEYHYLQSVYMVPNRFESRWKLAEFYLRKKDNAQAEQWAESIMILPVKIPSEKVDRIREAAMGLIKKLKPCTAN